MRLRKSLLAIGACVFTLGRAMLTITDEYKIQGGTTIYIYVSKCSTSIHIPHIQIVLTKHIVVATLGHKM